MAGRYLGRWYDEIGPYPDNWHYYDSRRFNGETQRCGVSWQGRSQVQSGTHPIRYDPRGHRRGALRHKRRSNPDSK